MNHAFPPVFQGRRYAVVGLGRNGLPAAQALVAMGATVSVWDDAAPARAAALAAGLGLIPPEVIAGPLDALVLSPGIPHYRPAPHAAAIRASALGVPIVSDAELLYQAVRLSGSGARFAGITGTNGKSTTTALLGHMLDLAGIEAVIGGNLGTAALALPLLGEGGVYVLEMSSYMLERLATLRFNAAALLNLSPDHLDRHGDMEGYARVKTAIFNRQHADDCAVIGTDDAWCRSVAATLGERGHRISGSNSVPSDRPALPGPHNAQNIAAARALALHLGADEAAIRRAVATFPGLPHRQQRVGACGGVTFIDDSKATNADAAARSLSCYPRCVWIAGGIGKQGGITSLAPLFPQVAHAILIGRDADRFAATLAGRVPYQIAHDLETAVPAAFAAARLADAPVVLLAPAAASFDQFTGFEARGQRFAALVAQIAQQPQPLPSRHQQPQVA